MATAAAKQATAWSDERLVRECRKGNHEAWAALVEKYKNLVFSIPVKFGLTRDEAADVFQAVWAEVLVSLPQLRQPRALPKWLMQPGYHQCLRWKKDRLDLFVDADGVEEKPDRTDELPEELLSQLQREQRIRDAVSSLPERCQRMVVMLFFEDPPRPYEDVARELQLATGSIGFIRARCLKKLRQLLEEKGLQ